MVNKILLSTAVILGGVSLISIPKVTSHGATFVQDVREGINMASPDGHEADRIRLLLRERRDELRDQRLKINSIERKAQAALEDCEALQERIAERSVILGRAREVLSGGSSTIVVSNRTYTREQVQQDAREHMRALEGLRIQLETKQSVATELTAAVTRHEADLAAAQQEVTKVEAELESLDLRLESARMRTLAQELSRDLELGQPAGLSELSGSWESYVARVEEAEARIGFMARVSDDHAVVDWSGTSEPEDILHEIDLALAGPRAAGHSADASPDAGPGAASSPVGAVSREAAPSAPTGVAVPIPATARK